MAAISSQTKSRVTQAVRRALVERRQVVELGSHKLRFQRRGDEWQEGTETLRAETSGVFARFPVTRGGAPAGGRWCHIGSTDDLEDVLQPYLDSMTEQDAEALVVGLVANVALTQMARHAQRHPAAHLRAADTASARFPTSHAAAPSPAPRRPRP